MLTIKIYLLIDKCLILVPKIYFCYLTGMQKYHYKPLNILRMHQYFHRRDVLDQVLCLTEKEELDPMTVIDDLFSDYGLTAIRKHLWQMTEACLTSENTAFDDPVKRTDQLSLYYNLEKFMEAAFILHTINRANALQKVA